MSSVIKVGKVQSSTGQDAVTIANDGSISGLTTNNIQPTSGQALTIKDEGGTASITVATNGEATFAENIKVTNGKGIDFSAVSTSGSGSTSAVLDDYEEGTWTPAGSNVDGAVGTYTKIGNMVFCQGWFRASGGTTAATITGLPFTSQNPGNSAQGGGFSSYQNNDSTNISQYGLLVANNNTQFYIYKGNSNEGIGDTKQMHFNLFYKT